MPFDKNDINSYNNNQENNNNNFVQINDNNINDDEENNYIPYYYGESPDFSGKHYSDLDAAGQFIYENNSQYYHYQGNSLFSIYNKNHFNSLFGNNTNQITGELFGNINKDQIAKGLFGLPPLDKAVKNTALPKDGSFVNMVFG